LRFPNFDSSISTTIPSQINFSSATSNLIYEGKSVKAVRLEEYDVLLSLEMKICRLESEKLVEEGHVPIDKKYIGVIGKPEGENELFFFDTKECASVWSDQIQKSKYSDETPWLENPFCDGSYIEVATLLTKGGAGSFLCLSESAILIDNSDIRPHLDIAFEVQTVAEKFLNPFIISLMET
jgi:hypothetical protein